MEICVICHMVEIIMWKSHTEKSLRSTIRSTKKKNCASTSLVLPIRFRTTSTWVLWPEYWILFCYVSSRRAGFEHVVDKFQYLELDPNSTVVPKSEMVHSRKYCLLSIC